MSWLLTAVLLAAPSPGDVGEPLHVRTHHQQEDGAGHLRGQRYARLCAAFDRDIGVTRVTAKSDTNRPHKLEHYYSIIMLYYIIITVALQLCLVSLTPTPHPGMIDYFALGRQYRNGAVLRQRRHVHNVGRGE